MTAPSKEDRRVLGGEEVRAAGLEGWSLLLGGLETRFETGDFATGLALVTAIGALAEEADHHPDLDLRYAGLAVRLRSHDVGGVTARDVRLARAVSAAAADAGVGVAPRAPHALGRPAGPAPGVQRVELALDTPDLQRVAPFWAALLGTRWDPEREEVVDPDGRLPTLWFQGTAPRPVTDPADAVDVTDQRFHLDVWVDPDLAEERVAAALAAGGTLVSDEDAPSFWVVADADGNRACVCTWRSRPDAA